MPGCMGCNSVTRRKEVEKGGVKLFKWHLKKTQMHL